MGWIASFVFLYAALYLFERKRVQLDWFQVLAVALVPALVHGIKMFAGLVFVLPEFVDIVVWAAKYLIVFALLWKMMGLAAARAAGYTVGLFVFDIAVLALLVVLFGNSQG